MLLPKLQKENRELTDLMAELAQPEETLELRYPISGEEYQATGQKMIDRFKVELAQQTGFTVNPENQEGIRFSVDAPFGTGWMLLRLSLHEPLLVMQVENDQAGQIQKQLPIFKAILAQDTQIDSTKLDQQINQ